MPAPADPRQLLSCVDAANALFWCASPAHQLDRYWKDGAIDGCLRQLDELKLCARLKFATDAGAREIVRELVARVDAPPPTMGVIWQPRAAAARADARGGGGGGAP